MKNCQVCGLVCEDVLDSCDACGEASWVFAVDVVADKPKKSAKKKAVQPVEVLQAPVVAPSISDEEFAAELANASELDLLTLIGEENLSPSWRALVEAEIDKRDVK